MGFFDFAVAAPSMKAALEAWGSNSNFFHQGVAKESSDAEVIAVAMSKPGVTLKRPVGSNGLFTEHAHLPTHLSAGEAKGRTEKHGEYKKQPSRNIDRKADRNTELAFKREQKRRESQRRKRRKRRRNASGAIRKSPKPKQHCSSQAGS